LSPVFPKPAITGASRGTPPPLIYPLAELSGIKNVVAYGDTDIFPYPFENTLFNHKEEDIVTLLTEIHIDFDSFLVRNPPEHENILVATGYNGFRWATQLDPFWNLYFLGITIALGDKIEKSRISTSRKKSLFLSIQL
jgi:hypothetical protein